MKQLLHAGPGLVIGIPTLGRPIPLSWAFAFKSMSTPINYNCIIHVVPGKPVADARNEIAQVAIDKEAKYLFFLSDDVVCPGHTLKQLIYRMEQDDNIGAVGGVYCSKCDPPAPLVFRGNGVGSYWDWKIGEFFEVTGLGMDCTLIRVDALKELKSEWFKTVDTDGYLDGINNAESWTEDIYFYKRLLEETKYKIYCEGSVICDHVDVYGGKVYSLPKDSLPMRQKLMKKDKKCLIIGPDISIHPAAEFDIVRVAADEAADYRGTYEFLPFDAEQFDWVLVTDPQFRVRFPEELRVLKLEGKLSIRYNPLIDTKHILNLFGGSATRAGEFIEVRNESSQTFLQSNEPNNNDNASVLIERGCA